MANATSSRGRSASLRLENPFSLKQVLSATRGATDAFSGIGRHVNGSLRKLGLKNIEAGVGCGIGIGHGFGVGIALKPGVIHGLQSSLTEAMGKVMMNLGNVPGFSSALTQISASMSNGISPLGVGGPSINSMQSSSSPIVESESKTARSTVENKSSLQGSLQEPTSKNYEQKGITSEKPIGTRTEKVIDNFLQNPLFQTDSEKELSDVGGNVRAMNNVLQMLLKHQQVIEELMEENQKLHRVLIEDLKIPPSKLRTIQESKNRAYYPCSECFECRRRNRKAAR
ncbi:uncharacterized protein LOC109718687 isoform X2 [Ananas comosus]|uniref:Uncharacterized protein LOC109718687 isoform X2 n=1 Tax=Ananas comosus TaxID=4615 RepID=A0A6P5FX99_ANACO|nr:uncharacterized protein LOC109718687 isoform X2 [Ananas comosus]